MEFGFLINPNGKESHQKISAFNSITFYKNLILKKKKKIFRENLLLK